MKNFPFSFERLFQFSLSDPYSFVPKHHRDLFERLKRAEKRLRFPAVKNDVGSALGFLASLNQSKRIFEMGSGYGHSAFWFFAGAESSIERAVLTEKRKDLSSVYEELQWPVNWKNRMEYWQGDAFEKLEAEEGLFDFFFVDGVKADYQSFVEKALPKLAKGGLIAVDNSYWRGSFLDAWQRERKASAAAIYRFHRFAQERRDLRAVFIPYADGLTLLRKLS